MKRIALILGLMLALLVTGVASATTWTITYSKTNVSGSDFDIRVESSHATTVLSETSPTDWAVVSNKVHNPFLLDEEHDGAVTWAVEMMNTSQPISDYDQSLWPSNMAAYEQWLEYRFLECLAAGNCDY